jgi:hypothetical protein
MVGPMVRPSLGDAARNKVGSTKVSAIEERALIERYGTVHSGLRAALDQLLAQQAPAKRKKRSAPEAAVAAAIETPAVPAGVVTPCRIHREFKVVKRWAEQGVDWTTRRCTVCGHEVSRPDRG